MPWPVLVEGSKCIECKVVVSKFIGVKNPIPQVTPATDSEEAEYDEAEWNIHELEELAKMAADSKVVTILHLSQDKVPPLCKARERPLR